MGEIQAVFTEQSITGGENMFLIISKQMNENAVNVLTKSRVWENHKHGSVGAVIADEPNINFMGNLL